MRNGPAPEHGLKAEESARRALCAPHHASSPLQGGTVLIPANDASGREGTSTLQCLYVDRRRVEVHVPTRLAATT